MQATVDVRSENVAYTPSEWQLDFGEVQQHVGVARSEDVADPAEDLDVVKVAY